MNKRDLCKTLNVSRPTLDKYFNQFKKELEPYIKRVNGRFTDFDTEGIEVLRQLSYIAPTEPSAEKRNKELQAQIEYLKKELEIKDNQIKEKEKVVDVLKTSNEELLADKRNLQSDIEFLKGDIDFLKAKNEKLGNHFIVKLLGWNKD